MTAFKKGILVIGLCIGAFFKVWWHHTDMTIVYPDSCAFSIDRLFSRPMQLEIKTFIDAAYKKDKNPSNLLQKIESHFSAIKSVVIDLQNPEVLNFSIRAYQPIFLLNHTTVVCQQGLLFQKNTFARGVLEKLENITFDGVISSKNIDRLLNFFDVVTDHIVQDFSIRWINKNAIWLDQKQGQDLSLLVGYDTIPTSNDIEQCRHIRGQVVDKPCKDKKGRPIKNNIRWVCDLRFDRQIILFSTNKGA